MGIGRYTGDISQVCNSAALASGNSTQLLPLGKRVRLKKITLTETDLNFSTLGIFFSLFNYDPPDGSDPPQNSLRE